MIASPVPRNQVTLLISNGYLQARHALCFHITWKIKESNVPVGLHSPKVQVLLLL